MFAWCGVVSCLPGVEWRHVCLVWSGVMFAWCRVVSCLVDGLIFDIWFGRSRCGSGSVF